MDTVKDTIDYLSQSHLLKYAPHTLISKLAPFVETIEVRRGEQLITKGDTGNFMYIVAHGSVRVHDKDVVLKILGQYELFGEVRALTADVSTASITAEQESRLLRIDQEDFYCCLMEYPQASKAIIKALVERQRGIINDVSSHAVKINVYEKELEIGRNIQKSFLPDVFPVVEGWRIDGSLTPAKEVAGDFFDFFRVHSINCLGVVIGDVCDKGIGAALFMSLFRSLIRFTSLSEDFTGWSDTTAADWSDWSGDELLEDNIESNLRNSITFANNYIATTHRKSSMFASVFFGLIDLKNGKLYYLNAGHEAPVILKPNGNIEKLEPTGPVIGLFPDIHYEIRRTRLEKGDALFAYTDGLPEAKDSNGNHFGDEKLINSLTQLYQSKGNMMQALFQEIALYTRDTPQYDDMTAVCIHKE